MSLRTDGRPALIDFGAVGRLSRLEHAALVDFFRGLRAEDPTLLRRPLSRSRCVRTGQPERATTCARLSGCAPMYSESVAGSRPVNRFTAPVTADNSPEAIAW